MPEYAWQYDMVKSLNTVEGNIDTLVYTYRISYQPFNCLTILKKT